MHCNGVRLVDLYRPGGALTWRLLGTLVRMLPPQAATWRAMGSDHLSRTDHYLAGLWELWAERHHPDRPGLPAHAAPSKTARTGRPRGTTPQAGEGDMTSRLLAHRKRYAEHPAVS